jgi:hypothetical protein
MIATQEQSSSGPRKPVEDSITERLYSFCVCESAPVDRTGGRL